ncbi:MAG: CDP-diacylglycerol--glycerol-3-phosphate 3-phosphatidyltransferase [Smithella sp. PtaU1.Bin162]|nr:MAG: CDP-diacylglycerol--glycerol-3-phosphate 3-phosphatidyltransferase [Smithella sp. PtaU1.Bin162]
MIAGHKTLNLPNTITLIRIGVVPFLFILLASPGEFWSFVLAALFVAASITDFVDGYIARKYQLITTMGKFLDPIADKLIVNTAMILMIPIGRIPAWIVAITIMRDLIVDGIRSISSSDGLFIQASRLGKQKTLAQIIAVTALMIHYPIFGIDAHFVGMIILYIAFFLTIYSGTDYCVKFYRRVSAK